MPIEDKHYAWLKKPGRLLLYIPTPFSAASPYSSLVPNLITHQAFAQELWKRNTTLGY